MSIVGYLKLVPERDIDAARADSNRIRDLLESSPEDPRHRILEYAPSVDAIFAFHFAFSGRTATDPLGGSPLEFLISGGWPLGGVDTGYGPPRAFSNHELHEIVRMAEHLDDVTVVDRLLDPRGVAHGARTDEMTTEERDAARPYLLHMFNEVLEFLANGANDGMGLLVFVS